MIILGLDPGTAIVGWGIIKSEGGKQTCLGYGVITTDKSMTDSQRLLAIANGVEALIDEHKPALVSIEKLFFSKNVTTAMTVSQARGVLMYVAERMGVPMVGFTPNEVKLALTGSGTADKQQMQKMVQLLLRLPTLPKPDDAADAVAIALIAAQTESFRKKVDLHGR
ncbi:MAG TPA: crossover junction endodeoxyribonuclease RuvC [Verrucomicrobiae bacterium]|nr:crossover junction endodeoxyribonuclease RuvC [Verrucomicrobiae bacterium]